MSDTIKNFLQNQDYTETEIKIYLDLLRYGQSFASTVAVRTGLDRTTAYSALKKLVKKGVVVQAQINDVYNYIPVSPEIFLQKIDDEMDRLLARRKMAKLFVDELDSLNKASFLKSNINIFEGAEAVKRLYERTLDAGTTQKVFTNIGELPDSMADFLKNRFIQLKLKKKVFSNVIVAPSRFAEKYAELGRAANRQTVIAKHYPFELYAEIVLYGGKSVAIIDFHDAIYGMLIESKTLYKTMESLFDYIWAAESAS